MQFHFRSSEKEPSDAVHKNNFAICFPPMKSFTFVVILRHTTVCMMIKLMICILFRLFVGMIFDVSDFFNPNF